MAKRKKRAPKRARASRLLDSDVAPTLPQQYAHELPFGALATVSQVRAAAALPPITVSFDSGDTYAPARLDDYVDATPLGRLYAGTVRGGVSGSFTVDAADAEPLFRELNASAWREFTGRNVRFDGWPLDEIGRWLRHAIGLAPSLSDLLAWMRKMLPAYCGHMIVDDEHRVGAFDKTIARWRWRDGRAVDVRVGPEADDALEITVTVKRRGREATWSQRVPGGEVAALLEVHPLERAILEALWGRVDGAVLAAGLEGEAAARS